MSRAGTTRGGETAAVPPVALPRRVIAALILLPYFSPGGKYVVSVTTDRNGSAAKAERRGTAHVNGFHADLTVSLDLRNLPQGTYYPATTHEGDRLSYYIYAARKDLLQRGMSETIRCSPWSDPGSAEVSPLPKMMEDPETGGVNCRSSICAMGDSVLSKAVTALACHRQAGSMASSRVNHGSMSRERDEQFALKANERIVLENE